MKNLKYWKIVFETETSQIWLPERSNRVVHWDQVPGLGWLWVQNPDPIPNII